MHNVLAASSILRSTPREKLRTAGLFGLAAILTFSTIAVNILSGKGDSNSILLNVGIGTLISIAGIQITRRLAAQVFIGEPIKDTEMQSWLSKFDKTLGTSSTFSSHRLKRLKDTAMYIKNGNSDVIATSMDDNTTPGIERKGATAHEYAHRHMGHQKEVENWHHWVFIIATIEPQGGVMATAIGLAVIRKNELQADRIAMDLTGDGYHLARNLTRSERKKATKPTATDRALDSVSRLVAMHPSSRRRAKALLKNSAKFKAIKKQFGLDKS